MKCIPTEYYENAYLFYLYLIANWKTNLKVNF